MIDWFVSVLSVPVTDEASDDASRKTVFGTDRWCMLARTADPALMIQDPLGNTSYLNPQLPVNVPLTL